MLPRRWWSWQAAVAAAVMVLALPARAAIFEDDDARKAILELRQRLIQLEQTNAQQAADAAKTQAQLREQIQAMQRSALELNAQLEALRGEIARLRGNDEQMARDLADVQRRQKDISQGVDDRIRKLEPLKVSVDGREFMADPEEKRQFEDALVLLRNGDYDKASGAFSGFLRRYPASGYADSARFWLGNAQYGKREYKDAITSFRALVANSPDHLRAPEALLAVANCQLEAKDPKAARATIGELIKTYPKSEAAQAGRERLAALK
jgi:tol-pal system protein YbgF